MADFNITLDTSPMAESIDTVNGHVRTVTGAVIAMQSAVVAEEHSTSQQICENVDNGFYILMKSQLSQKVAACSSTMSSKLMLMKKFRADINRIQDVMQDDYNRICRRYHKQFTALDKALETRIHELDRAAMEIGVLQHKMFTKLRDDSCSVICYDRDTQLTAEQSVTAKVKNKAVKALSAMASDVSGSLTYNRKVEHILKNEKLASREDAFLPVLMLETDSMFNSANKVSNVFVAQNDCFSKTDVVANQIQAAAASYEWQPVAKEEHDKVQNDFMQKCSASGIDERVAKEMVRLFNESSWAVPKTDGGVQ